MKTGFLSDVAFLYDIKMQRDKKSFEVWYGRMSGRLWQAKQSRNWMPNAYLHIYATLKG